MTMLAVVQLKPNLVQEVLPLMVVLIMLALTAVLETVTSIWAQANGPLTIGHVSMI